MQDFSKLYKIGTLLHAQSSTIVVFRITSQHLGELREHSRADRGKVRGELEIASVFEDEQCCAVEETHNPQAATHYLMFPELAETSCWAVLLNKIT